MLKSAMRIGLKVDEFWNSTPLELSLHADVYVDNRKESVKEMITHAYTTAYLHRVKKMPKLEKMIKDIDGVKQHKVQSAEEMLEVVKMLNKAFGGD